ncbi:MAG: AAA family ATPase [Anaerolineales bacterium]|nr:AAA family ATPase [Anaerolineales bacterium]
MPQATLDFFIPEDRRQALLKGETLPAHSHGAVLFADLSGFTKITSDLSIHLGPKRGAEELNRQLDPIYTELIGAVHNYGGSVVDITGDGLTCWFNEDSGERAASCAAVMQGIMEQFKVIKIPSISSFTLGIKITISVGAVQRFLVGDPAIQLLEALAGRELLRVVRAQELIHSGEIAVYEEVFGRIKDKVENVSWRQVEGGERIAVFENLSELAAPRPWPAAQNLEIEVAKKWVFRPIYERIAEGELEFLTEFRLAVPMFLKFSGIDYDQDESAEKKLDQFVQCVQGVVSRHEGYLCNLTIGDKGSNLYIIFGAPLAHEDSIDRALAAALRIKAEVQGLGFIDEIQIGLTHGQVWAGAHGGGKARTYSAMGAEVNLAARLMSYAGPGQILVSPHVAEQGSNYEFTQLSPIEFKGIEKPMTPSLLMGKTKSHTINDSKTAILGREREQKFLSRALSNLSSTAGSAGTVVIEGDAGIGKSRLLSDFSEHIRQSGYKVLAGQADPVETTTQYFAFKSILDGLFEITELDDQKTIQNKVLMAIQDDEFLASRAPLLSSVLPLHWPDNELTSQMMGEARATSTREVLLRILQNSRLKNINPAASLVLLFDDAHWLDAATWSLLGYINRELTSILLVLATRPITKDEVSAQIVDEFHRILSAPNTHHIQLANLNANDTTELVSQKLGVKHVPAPVLEFIHARAQGNPFFSEEIAYALRDSGIIGIQGDSAVTNHTAGELAEIDFPETVQGVVTRRVDRLPAPHQLTLKVASVIGRIFILNILANVHPARVAKSTLAEYLQTLTRQGITDLESPDPEIAYFFKHVIIQEVVYNLLTFSQRKQLHCAIANWYETNHAGDLTPHYSRLAHHWLKGEKNDKAIHYLEKAAEQSLKLYSNEDVVRFLEIAIELDKRETTDNAPAKVFQRARWERMLGIAFLRLGKLKESESRLSLSLKLLGRPLPKTAAGAILFLIKELGEQALRRISPKSLARKYSADRLKVEEELARIEIEHIFYYAQNTTMLAWSMLRRLNLAEKTQMPELMMEGYGNLQMISGLAGLDGVYQVYKKLGQDILSKNNNIPGRIFLMLREGVVRFTRCEWEQADENLEGGLRLAEQIGDIRSYIELVASHATSLHLQGRFEKSLERWQEQYQKVSRSDSPQGQAWALYGQGHNLLMLGKTREAIQLIEDSINTPMKNADDKILNTSRFGALSLAYLRSGQNEPALENVFAHQRHAPAKPGLASTMHEYSPVFDAIIGLWKIIQTGQSQLENAQIKKLEQIFHKIPFMVKALGQLRINKAKCLLYSGIYNNLTGGKGKAETDFVKCIELAGKHRQPYELGRAYYELGLLLGAREGRDYLSQAAEIFEGVKTPYELEQVRAALAGQDEE